MKIKDVISALECFAPLPLQESYDNAGLQVGLTEAEVSGVLLCLDITEQVLAEAVSKDCNMVVSHHPLIFRKLAHVTGDDYVQRCVIYAIKHDLTLVSMHTNLDSVTGGVNHMMAQKLGLRNVCLLNPTDSCGTQSGMGTIGDLPEPLSAQQFMSLVKEVFHAECIMSNALISRKISRVAMCGGAGAFVLPDAMAAGADAFITGEMSYHTYFGHDDDVQIAVIGHYESEQYTIQLLQQIINSRCEGVRTVVTEVNTNPIRYNSKSNKI